MAVFIYVDSTNRRLDEANLDPRDYLTPDAESTPRGKTLVRSANLLAVMEVPYGRNRDRIADALLAGPPQGDRSVTVPPPDTTGR